MSSQGAGGRAYLSVSPKGWVLIWKRAYPYNSHLGGLSVIKNLCVY